MRLYELTERTTRRNGVSALTWTCGPVCGLGEGRAVDTDRAVLTQRRMLWARKQPEPGRDLSGHFCTVVQKVSMAVRRRTGL